MKWLELCVYTLLPCVQSSFQIIIYLWGTNKHKYMSEIVNAVGSYCDFKVDPESSVWLRAACCNSLSQDLSQLPLSHSKLCLRNCPTATNLDFLFHKIYVGDRKNCSKFLWYFDMINTNLDIHHWKFMIESGGPWFQIMPLHLPENGIQGQWQEKEVPRNQSYQQT